MPDKSETGTGHKFVKLTIEQGWKISGGAMIEFDLAHASALFHRFVVEQACE